MLLQNMFVLISRNIFTKANSFHDNSAVNNLIYFSMPIDNMKVWQTSR